MDDCGERVCFKDLAERDLVGRIDFAFGGLSVKSSTTTG
jgi:hypothetical protein